MLLEWLVKETRETWKSIEKALDIDTYEGWLRNGLPLCVGAGLLFIGFCIGFGLLERCRSRTRAPTYREAR